MNKNTEKQLKKIEFRNPSFSETISCSHLQISTHLLHSKHNSTTCSGGLNDPRLGSNENFICKTCFKNLNQCCGHFGFLKLFLPVFNIGYIKAIHGILQVICKNCSRILLRTDKDYDKILKLVQTLRKKDPLSRIKSFSLVIENCRRQKWCPHCNCKNGKIRKIGTWNFVYEVEPSETKLFDLREIKDGKNFKSYKKDIILDPLQIFFILQRINRIDYELLDLDPFGTKPENFLLSILPIPPLVIRPRISISSKFTNEDDLTIRLAEIQNLNSKIKKLFFSSEEISTIWEIWGILQIESARYLNSEIFIGDKDNNNLTGIYQRLKGKNGRFRGSLGGKRVDFSGRTVISPDPNMELNSIGVPLNLALKLTFPEKITKFNWERLKRNVLKGPNKFPGANYILGQNWKRNLFASNCSKITLEHFKEGNVVERHIKDNDIIMFNRQPSLHRISIMAHRVKIKTSKTFRLNECVCKPYNADFDGDEMNIHIPQTQKSRAEAIILMNPIKNSKTPKNGQTMIAATQDFLTFSYLLTSKDLFFSHPELFKICGFFETKILKNTTIYPAVIKPKILWTGKQVFSWIFFSIEYSRKYLSTKNSKINEFNVSKSWEEKPYSFDEKNCTPFLCPYDGYVIVRNWELLSGRIGKSSIGNGSKTSLQCVIENIISDRNSAISLYNISKSTYNWFSQFGFSICLDDIIPDIRQRSWSYS